MRRPMRASYPQTYLVVAQEHAYVFQPRNFPRGKGERPDFPANIKVPEDMVFPEKP